MGSQNDVTNACMRGFYMMIRDVSQGEEGISNYEPDSPIKVCCSDFGFVEFNVGLARR